MTATEGCKTCGGRIGHVPGCAEGEALRRARDEEDRASTKRWHDEQFARRQELRGKSVRQIITARDGGSPNVLTIEFTNGVRLVARLTGRELDGHDECSDQSMVVTVQTKAEHDKKIEPWRAWYDRDTAAHPRKW